MIQVKRVYDAASETDGYRILVDRLWPRGVTKERSALDLWLKEIAPSPELRVWFGHKPENFQEFSKRYNDELAHNPAVEKLHDLMAAHKTITLLYGAKDPLINHALVLQKFLQK